jgi:hypothetical protein
MIAGVVNQHLVVDREVEDRIVKASGEVRSR